MVRPLRARSYGRRWCAASTSRASFPDRDARREGYFQLSAGSLAPMLLGRVDPSETSTFSSMSGRWRSRVSCVRTDNFAFLLATSARRIVTVRQVGKHMSVCVRRPRVSLRYHRGSVSALEAQQPFGRVAIHARREYLSFAFAGRSTDWPMMGSDELSRRPSRAFTATRCIDDEKKSIPIGYASSRE